MTEIITDNDIRYSCMSDIGFALILYSSEFTDYELQLLSGLTKKAATDSISQEEKEVWRKAVSLSNDDDEEVTKEDSYRVIDETQTFEDFRKIQDHLTEIIQNLSRVIQGTHR